jgi:hypothetical protein
MTQRFKTYSIISQKKISRDLKNQPFSKLWVWFVHPIVKHKKIQEYTVSHNSIYDYFIILYTTHYRISWPSSHISNDKIL